MLASEPPPSPAFAFTAQRLTPALERRVTGSSWHEGCPVPLRRLRYVTASHQGFDGETHTGELIVNRDAVRPLRRVFARLYAKRFPIRRMRLVDDYDASDFDSIEADNTSAFNCRAVDGTDRWSEHAYGRAIDVNPIENPYVYANGTTSHPASAPYLDRTRKRPGMARRHGVVVRAFKAAGWGWGGTWKPARDLQHFSARNR